MLVICWSNAIMNCNNDFWVAENHRLWFSVHKILANLNRVWENVYLSTKARWKTIIKSSGMQQAFILCLPICGPAGVQLLQALSVWGLGLGLFLSSHSRAWVKGVMAIQQNFSVVEIRSVRRQAQLYRHSSSLCSCHVCWHLIGWSQSHGQIQPQWDIEVYFYHGKGGMNIFLATISSVIRCFIYCFLLFLTF